MKTKDLKITDIEFDLIKQNLKNFLKSQQEFTGYNFEGSALNIILDVLAYNTYYQAFYNNMTVNEMFLDSATKRSSIVSIAKHFAYRPKTITSARCEVQITIDAGEYPTSGTLPRGTRVNAIKDGFSYMFFLPIDANLVPSSYYENGNVREYSTDTVTLIEGVVRKYSFVADSGDSTQRFVIPYKNVDASTLKVQIQANSSSTEFETFYEATNITEVTEESLVYYLEENSDGYLELLFGDGVLGKRLENGNVIRIEIVESSGSAANGIGIANSTNVFGGAIGYSTTSTRLIVPSSGGTDKESKESIRFNVTRNYVTQNRAVTKEDYRNIILKDFNSLEDVICWGGEENDPIQYGKVFISVKPKEGVFLSSDEKSKIVQTLTRTRNVVGVLVEFVDPEVLYLNLTVNVKIDPINLPEGTNQIISDIRQSVYSFTEEYLDKFDKDLYSTELSTSIQEVNNNIVSNEVLVVLEKRFVPLFDLKSHNYVLKLNNKLYHPEDGYKSILSTNLFGYFDKNGIDRDCELDEDGYGNIRLFYTLNGNKIIINSKIGSIDYDKGIIYLNKFKPTSLIDQKPISVYCVPNESDIVAKQKMFLVHDFNDPLSLVINQTLVPYKNR
jgi:hypothetical protein